MIESILQILNGKLSEQTKIDFNALSPEIVVKAIAILEEFIFADAERIVGPATKVIEVLSLLPSQSAEEYLINFTSKAQEIAQSRLIFTKLAEVAVKK